MTKTTLLLSLLALGSLACQQPANNEISTPEPEATTATAESEPEIEYEPAYPADVSSEALSEADVHSHDSGDEHPHDDEGGHDHGDEGGHDDHKH